VEFFEAVVGAVHFDRGLDDLVEPVFASSVLVVVFNWCQCC
jgi:hypothetical protein